MTAKPYIVLDHPRVFYVFILKGQYN